MTDVDRQWWLYLIRCADGSLYTGISTDPERRLAEHQAGGVRAARYLRGRGPLQLVYCSPAGCRATAGRVEYCVKRLSLARKRALVDSGEAVQQWLHHGGGRSNDTGDK